MQSPTSWLPLTSGWLSHRSRKLVRQKGLVLHYSVHFGRRVGILTHNDGTQTGKSFHSGTLVRKVTSDHFFDNGDQV